MSRPAQTLAQPVNTLLAVYLDGGRREHKHVTAREAADLARAALRYDADASLYFNGKRLPLNVGNA